MYTTISLEWGKGYIFYGHTIWSPKKKGCWSEMLLKVTYFFDQASVDEVAANSSGNPTFARVNKL